jgi:hypothetical protein
MFTIGCNNPFSCSFLEEQLTNTRINKRVRVCVTGEGGGGVTDGEDVDQVLCSTHSQVHVDSSVRHHMNQPVSVCSARKQMEDARYTVRF